MVPSALRRILDDTEVKVLASGIPFDDCTMLICFCDLIGSTRALRWMGAKAFRAVQTEFLKNCGSAVREINNTRTPENSALVLDKFMGDGAMFYIYCGSLPLMDDILDTEDSSKRENLGTRKHRKREAALMMMELISRIVTHLQNINEQLNYTSKSTNLGARFGVASGDRVTLSVLGTEDSESLTVTGEAVNLAARLEHATEAEFLHAIATKKAGLDTFAHQLSNPSALHGSRLANRQDELDRNIVELQAITAKKFQIRADRSFVSALESTDDVSAESIDKKTPDTANKFSSRLAWKKIPFEPRGFGESDGARLVGGDTLAELFRVV